MEMTDLKAVYSAKYKRKSVFKIVYFFGTLNALCINKGPSKKNYYIPRNFDQSFSDFLKHLLK